MSKKRGTRSARRAMAAAVDALEPRLLLANVSINELLAVNVAGITDEEDVNTRFIMMLRGQQHRDTELRSIPVQ